jgi:hypothetical protein
MNKQEAKRYAHKIAADAIDRELDVWLAVADTSDGQQVLAALRAVVEQHRRFGPKSTDHVPQLRAPLDTPLLDVLDREPRQMSMADGRP